MYTMIGTANGDFMKITKAYNNEYYPQEELKTFVSEGEMMVEVEEYKDFPKNAKEGCSYINYYNLKTGQFMFEEQELPLTEEEKRFRELEERIVKLEQTVLS